MEQIVSEARKQKRFRHVNSDDIFRVADQGNEKPRRGEQARVYFWMDTEENGAMLWLRAHGKWHDYYQDNTGGDRKRPRRMRMS